MRMRGLFAVLFVVLLLPTAAAADDWWPHPADATWTYQWTDSVYNPTPTKEKVSVRDQKGKTFMLAWTTRGPDNPSDASVSLGTMTFQETTAGLVNTDWTSNPPPPDFPILCPQINGCNNALSSTMYYLIWGSRSPVLAEPLLAGSTWAGTGGADGSVSSTSTYQGIEKIKVAAFENEVTAAKVRSDVTQAGAIGDPYGSGVRIIWWVYGVGPVKILFQHGGGSDAPVTTSELISTNQTPKAPPTDTNFFPLKKGMSLKYRWTNRKLFKKPSIQKFTLDEVINNSARFTVKDVSGPLRVAGTYGFSLRLDGLTNLWTSTKAATLVKFPRLAKKRHFFTPFDLLVYGFNPVLPAYPAPGAAWASKNPSRDFSIFGVSGTTRILGLQRVKVPAGSFNAIAVRSTLKQPGSKFGSG